MKLQITHSDYSFQKYDDKDEHRVDIYLSVFDVTSSNDYIEVLRFVQNFVDEFGKTHVVVPPSPPTLSELGLRYDAETGTVGPKLAEMIGPVFLDQKAGLAELVVNTNLSTPTGPFVKPTEPSVPKMAVRSNDSSPPQAQITPAEAEALAYIAQASKTRELDIARAKIHPHPEEVMDVKVEQPAPAPAPELEPVKEEPAPPADPEPPTEDQLITEEFQKGCFNVKTLEQAIELWSAFYSRMSKFGKPFTDARGVDLTMALADALQIEAQEAKAMIREAIKKMQVKPATPAEAPSETPKPAVLDLSETVEALVKKFEELESDPKLTESEVFRSSIVICAVPGKQTTDPQRVYSVMREALERHVKSRNGSMIKGFFPTDSILSDRILSEKNAKFLMMTKVAKLPIEKVEK